MALLVICKKCGAEDSRHGNAKFCSKCAPKTIPLSERSPKPCVICGTDLVKECSNVSRLGSRKYCNTCITIRRKTYWKSRAAVNGHPNEIARKITHFAVKVGFLSHPSIYICMDCKRRQAECYDHRDYSKPLEVEAVCLPCNSSRGRGIPLVLPDQRKPKTEAA